MTTRIYNATAERHRVAARHAARAIGDEAPVLAAEAGVFGLADLVERLAEMAHDVEFVEQDRRLRRFVRRDITERLPHVHHDELDFAALPEPQLGVEPCHAGLRTIFAAEPDRPLANQVADRDAIVVALADRDLVDADRLGSSPGAPARSNWARMYCISSVLTVPQSSFSSLTTSRIEACRQRRPT
jgi:hypothetical protein